MTTMISISSVGLERGISFSFFYQHEASLMRWLPSDPLSIPVGLYQANGTIGAIGVSFRQSNNSRPRGYPTQRRQSQRPGGVAY